MHSETSKNIKDWKARLFGEMSSFGECHLCPEKVKLAPLNVLARPKNHYAQDRINQRRKGSISTGDFKGVNRFSRSIDR